MVSPWLILWALFSLVFRVLSDVKAREEPVLERSVLGDREEGVSGVGSSLSPCLKLSNGEPLALQSGGDVVIGGLFPLHYMASRPEQSYLSEPQFTPCRG